VVVPRRVGPGRGSAVVLAPAPAAYAPLRKMRTATRPSDVGAHRGDTPSSETRTAAIMASASKHSLRATNHRHMNHRHMNHRHTYYRHAEKTAVQVVPQWHHHHALDIAPSIV
jgi:hypothetical protein